MISDDAAVALQRQIDRLASQLDYLTALESAGNSGTFTPTIVLGANAAAVTVSVAHYLRVGSVVSVFGRCECDPTLAATLTVFTLSLPIASNLGGIEQLAGGFWNGSRTTGNTGEIKGETTADTAQFAITPVGAANVAYYYSYGYRVI